MLTKVPMKIITRRDKVMILSFELNDGVENRKDLFFRLLRDNTRTNPTKRKINQNKSRNNVPIIGMNPQVLVNIRARSIPSK